jgi:methylmalonyl-CoA mutase
MTDELPLGSDFPPATREQWRKLVEAAIKEGSFESRLVTRTYDDLRIEPLYPAHRQAATIPFPRPGSDWTVMQRLDHPRPADANAEALHDAANGATGLALVFAGATGAYGYGLPVDEQAISCALEEIDLRRIVFDIDCHALPTDIANMVAAVRKRSSIAATEIDIRFGLDPIGAVAASGGAALASGRIGIELCAAVSELSGQGFRGPFAVADGRLVHNAGGSEAQELAYVLAVGVEYLRMLEGAGIALAAARAMIYFRLSIDAQQFLTMSKLRALRKLWARVEQSCGLRPAPILIAAETAWRMMTRRDPHVNMLRTTIAVIAAGLGGADSITVLPFTMALGLPDRFARRIARNTQLVLSEESNLAKVADPAAGAGGIESVTEELCRASWKGFQEIESAGGICAALQQSLIQQKIAAVRAERERAVATRKDAITGTSDFPDLAELPVSVAEGAPRMPVHHSAPLFAPFPSFRLAQPFEELRDASDRIFAKSGVRPQIFLACLGEASHFSARANFARNLFAAGGIEAIGGEAFRSNEEMIGAFRSRNVRLACLCSTDEIYAREGAAAAAALRNAGATVWLAGRPKTHADELRKAGVSGFVFAGCDALAELRAAHRVLQS